MSDEVPYDEEPDWRESVAKQRLEKRQLEMAQLAEFRRTWRDKLGKKATLAAMYEHVEWFEELSARHPWHLEEDQVILDELYDRIEVAEGRLISVAQQDCPIAYFKPSWEQAQCMNAWHPDYEPELAPEGYRNVCNFSAKRVAKTWGSIASNVLWMVPGEKDWPIYTPYTDHLGREVRVLWRFNWDYWRKTGKRCDPGHGEPPKSACVFWHGVGTENDWLHKIDPVYRGSRKDSPGMPDKWVAKIKGERVWNRSEKWFQTMFEHKVMCKLYGSDQQQWGGDEVHSITLDEGPPLDKLSEAYIRARYLHWAYTPYEPANTGDRARLARNVYKGQFQLIGKTKFFFFKMADVAPHVMDPRDRDERIETARKHGGMEMVAIEGGFRDSSPNVFDQFNPGFHVLPVTGAQVVAAIRGELDSLTRAAFPWLEKFERANIIRGFDEGLAHPTAACWLALLRSGELVAYRDLEAVATSITERVEKIIDLSGNRREEIKRTVRGLSENQIEIARQYAPHLLQDAQRERATGSRLARYHEIMRREYVRRTFADSKIFKRDPNYPLDDWTQNYIRAGLRMERATNQGPAARCDYVNTLLRPDPTRQHLNPEQGVGINRHGAGLYITMDCTTMKMRLEEYLWGQLKAGEHRGEFTGKPEKIGDDLIDALCYGACARLRWTDPAQYMRSAIMPMAA